ncbi:MULTISPECIES: hypothetical protein [Providencia]|uniref:hypothetical protein n=1 Tax=Providencia TaxID=586 RepID=UPI001E5C5288|nr:MULTISPECIES: hypothetical protein [Providencia]WAZ77765.1 hypothetical protein O4001_16240 [Providencia stuartii]WAZ81089.1 hypothetical protein O4002_11760 [Providencia stuartii]
MSLIEEIEQEVLLCGKTLKFNFHKQRLYHYDAPGSRIHKVVESRAYGKVERHETHFVWQGLRLLQEQDINTGKYQTYCYEEHGSYTPLAVIVK